MELLQSPAPVAERALSGGSCVCTLNMVNWMHTKHRNLGKLLKSKFKKTYGILHMLVDIFIFPLKNQNY